MRSVATMSLTSFLARASLQCRMYEPSEEGNLVQTHQQYQVQGGVQDDEREGTGPPVVPDQGQEYNTDDEHVVQEIEQAVLADEAQRLPVSHKVEHQQRHGD